MKWLKYMGAYAQPSLHFPPSAEMCIMRITREKVGFIENTARRQRRDQDGVGEVK